jgi:endonuclease/exonuclease/phosphatase family metal-dependent hydrolase
MPWYTDIKPDTPAGRRTIERLLDLRTSLDAEIPRRSDHLILLATWNVREFDSAAYGTRTNEPLQYIAEIISRFDIVAVTEVRSDLKALHKLMRLLGSHWDYIVTDVTAGTAGNRERLAVVYDTNKVTFGGLAGELVLPPVDTVDADGDKITVSAAQFARTPLLAGFRSKWVDFTLAVFHVVWGGSVAVRRNEVAQLTEALAKKADAPTSWSKNLVILGDFNIGSPDDVAWKELRSAGWVIPPDFVTDIRGTNIDQSKSYDQIAVRPRPGFFDLATIDGRPAAGAYNYYDVVYRPRADFETYRDEMEALKPSATNSNFTFDGDGDLRTAEGQERWYRSYWRTHQMSDHLPLWVAIKVDNTDDYLKSKLP